MRLINTSKLQLEEFLDNDLPDFATLSHTWSSDEVSFQQFQNGAINDKIRRCCERATADGFGYVWIDTCCIDKTSSAELSEAINSMYTWYHNSGVCYAYLEDFELSDPQGKWWNTAELEPDTVLLERKLRKCRWFGRGWTLQELIAPPTVEFYDCTWAYIGTRMSLKETISEITRIPIAVLTASQAAQDYNAAVRMSWAAHRKTRRLEDEAYCLLGLFDINMPLLYGEGRRAFQRLQEEILRRLEDYSLFAWPRPRQTEEPLADTPSHFDNSKLEKLDFEDLLSICADDYGGAKQPTISSRGISITLPLLRRTTPAGYLHTFAIICLVRKSRSQHLKDPSTPLTFLCLQLSRSSSNGSTSPTYRIERLVLNGVSLNIDDIISTLDDRPFSRADLRSFHSADITLFPVVSTQFNDIDSGSFSLRLRVPSEVRPLLQTLPLQPAQLVFGSQIEDFWRTTRYQFRDRAGLVYLAPRDAGAAGAGLAFGLHGRAPWCSFLRPLDGATFERMAAGWDDWAQDDLLDEIEGFPGSKTDFCRMRVAGWDGCGAAWLVARARKRRPEGIFVDEVGTESEADKKGEGTCPELLLEVAAHVSPVGARPMDEVGVLAYYPDTSEDESSE